MRNISIFSGLGRTLRSAPTILFLLLTLASCLAPHASHAIDFTATGTQITILYVEPALNTDGSKLTDLDHTNFYYQIGTQPEVKSANVPAVTLTGGSKISQVLTLPIGPGSEVNLTVTASATDKSGNEGPRTAPVVKRIDRLAPAAPQ